MYKVLIADDEKHVVSLIKNLVDWTALDMEVVGSAPNGKKGIEMVCELKPDILIADVLMPGYDGITLMKKVREIDRDIKVIMISGHKRFEYAKSVMKYNVEDYLLKPIDKNELEGLLKKIKSEIDQRQQERENKNRMHEKLGANKALMNALFMENLLSGELFERDTDLNNVNDMYFTEFFPNAYRCIILKLDHADRTVDEGFEEDLLLSVNQELVEIMEESCDVVLSFINLHRINLLMSCAQNAQNKADQAIERAFSASAKKISRHAGFSQTLGLGNWIAIDEDLAGLQKSIQLADRAVNSRFLLGSGNIVEGKLLEATEDGIAELLTEEETDALRKDIRSADPDAIKKRVEKIFGAVQGLVRKDAEVYTKTAWALNSELYRYIRLFDDNETRRAALEKELRKELEGCATVRMLVEAVVGHLNRNIEEAVGDGKGNVSPAVRTAKKYIKSNYAKNISLGDVAQVVNLSPVYFSVLFKKETGANFIDYLNKVRIDAAKNMLKEVRYNISEIAEGCGFSDNRYFSKIFKKFVGITPSDYRNRQIL